MSKVHFNKWSTILSGQKKIVFNLKQPSVRKFLRVSREYPLYFLSLKLTACSLKDVVRLNFRKDDFKWNHYVGIINW